MKASDTILPVESLPPMFRTFLQNPESISHMLFVGPPGSGKTTTALSFAAAMHGSKWNRFASILFLNSSDERSLDVMRQKVYPFVESRMQSIFFALHSKFPPKFIIFDEAETLTDQAQCALRPLLEYPTSEVIVIFICNSLSHIHPNILGKFLSIPFPPVHRTRMSSILNHEAPPQMDILLRRADLRYFKQTSKYDLITEFLFTILHARTFQEFVSACFAPGVPFRERISWILMFLQGSNLLSVEDIPYWSALTSSELIAYARQETLEASLITLWKTTFERICPPT
jgi:hypothetical protein